MNDLTAFQRDTLRVIGGMDEPIGLDVKEELEQYYDEDVNHGRLYPNLDTLVKKGLIRKEELDGRTNTYTITPDGEAKLRARTEFNEKYNNRKIPKNLNSPLNSDV